jgi:type VI protein secretion system component VasK
MHVEKDVTMITSQRRLSLLWMCVLLLVFVIPYLFPQWDIYVAQFLQTHLLFIGVLLLTLLFLLLWKYPQRQVATVRDKKDRIDLEAKSRQTLAQIVGGAVLFTGVYFTAQTLRTTQETLRVNQKTLETTQQAFR